MFSLVEHISEGGDLYASQVPPVCRGNDLTYMEFTVLMFLANNPQYDTAAQIVRMRRLTKSHVSVSLRRLQERGLVAGVYFPGNQKKLHLRVTEAAQGIVEAGRQIQRAFAEKLLQGFSPEEREQMRKLLTKIYQNMKREEEQNAEE